MKNIFTALFILTTLFTTYSQDTINVPGDYTTIQAAIDAANNGDIVLVADGTYYENINYLGKAITVASHFLIDGNETHIDSTIIDGNQNGSVVSFVSGEDTTAVLCGFTITGGLSPIGGGILCYSSGGKIIHNKIVGNTAFTRLGGWGGGICASADSNQYWIVIEHNEIKNNQADYWEPSGGGIFIRGVNGRICNNVIAQNSSTKYGSGGGIFIEDSQSIIINNTIVNNTAGWRGGGIVLNVESIIMNSVVWGNIALVDSQIYEGTGSLDVYYSDIQGGWRGIGNIDVYPEFVDTANGDYHLSNNSPCIGAGIDSLEIAGTWYYCPVTDLEGNPRPNPPGTMPDMGAYENPLSVPTDVDDDLIQFPKTFSLSQNYPNPFNSTSVIRYSVPQSSSAVIKVFDILGNEIETLVNEETPVGSYKVEYDASTLPSGVYFYRLQAGGFVQTKKMILMK